jgi:hypothetical protein
MEYWFESGLYTPPFSGTSLHFKGQIRDLGNGTFNGTLYFPRRGEFTLEGFFQSQGKSLRLIALANLGSVLDLQKQGIEVLSGDYSGKWIKLPRKILFNPNIEEFLSRFNKLKDVCGSGVVNTRLIEKL